MKKFLPMRAGSVFHQQLQTEIIDLYPENVINLIDSLFVIMHNYGEFLDSRKKQFINRSKK